MLVRFYNATTKIVAGSDQRYKRNRGENPAVLPYLAWGVLLLKREHQLLDGNFVVAVERTLNEYYSARRDVIGWFAHPDVWQDVAAQFQVAEVVDPTDLDRARKELQSALKARIVDIHDRADLSWLLPPRQEPQAQP
jgi:hypothetical protein